MATILLRLVAPMMSWGTRSHFDDRDTELEPSKSGVLGLCAAALGIDRHQPIEDLAALAFGVRVDQPGLVRVDYHTAQLLIPGSRKRPHTDVTRRAFLSDAAFWGALSGDPELLARLYAALKNPRWSLALGRKAFPPSLPLWFEPPSERSLYQALLNAPSLRRERASTDAPSSYPYRLVIEKAEVPADATPSAWSPSRRRDAPLGSFAERRYATRDVLSDVRDLTLPTDPILANEDAAPEPPEANLEAE